MGGIDWNATIPTIKSQFSNVYSTFLFVYVCISLIENNNHLIEKINFDEVSVYHSADIFQQTSTLTRPEIVSFFSNMMQ